MLQMKRHITILLACGLVLCKPGVLVSQQSMQLSLKQAIDYAIGHNYEVKNAIIDVRIAQKKVAETTATGLPQISAGVSYMNYPDIPVQLLPDFLSPAVYGVLLDEGLVQEMPEEASGRLFEAQFGTQHNATAKAELSQLIFSGSYLVGLQASQAYLEFSKTRLKKAHAELRETISNAYYQALVSERSLGILDSTQASLQKMYSDIQAMNLQGFVEETDVDQLGLLVADIEATLSQVEYQHELSMRMLKFHMGLGLDQELILTDQLESLIAGVNADALLLQAFEQERHIDFAIMRNQELLSRLQLKLQKAAYLPTIAGFYSYQQVAQRQEFDFFDSDGKWFPTQVIGAQIDIPIFSSGYRRYKVQQAKLEWEKTQVMTTQLGQALQLGAENARNNLRNAALIYANKERALGMASRIYDRTMIRFKEGMASSMDFQQAHNQFLQAEGDYITAMYQLLTAKAAYDKAFANE